MLNGRLRHEASLGGGSDGLRVDFVKSFPRSRVRNGRFAALYLGSVAPVPQGWFDTRYAPSCRSYLTVGPGKVVLHQ